MKRFNIGCLVKVLAIIAIIAFIGFLYMTCSDNQGCYCVQSIDSTLPDKVKAPYSVITMTHLYYAAYAVQNPDGSVTMQDWYDRVEGKWLFREGMEKFPASLRPKLSMR